MASLAHGAHNRPDDNEGAVYDSSYSGIRRGRVRAFARRDLIEPLSQSNCLDISLACPVGRQSALTDSNTWKNPSAINQNFSDFLVMPRLPSFRNKIHRRIPLASEPLAQFPGLAYLERPSGESGCP